MTETDFKNKLIKEIKTRFPGSIVIKNDPNAIQGIPDLTVFFGKRWGTLECKKDAKAPHRPNQDYYVNKMDNMSFSSFIWPEVKDEVLYRMERRLKDDLE